MTYSGIGMSDVYNDIPETRGTARNKGTFNGLTARDLEDEVKRAAYASTFIL